jgi:hypothetical protein
MAAGSRTMWGKTQTAVCQLTTQKILHLVQKLKIQGALSSLPYICIFMVWCLTIWESLNILMVLNDTVSATDITCYWMKWKDDKKQQNKQLWCIWWYYPSINWDRLRKTIKTLKQDSQWFCSDWNWVASQSWAPPLHHLAYSVAEI